MTHSKAVCISNPENLNKAFKISLSRERCFSVVPWRHKPGYVHVARSSHTFCGCCSFLAKSAEVFRYIFTLLHHFLGPLLVKVCAPWQQIVWVSKARQSMHMQHWNSTCPVYPVTMPVCKRQKLVLVLLGFFSPMSLWIWEGQKYKATSVCISLLHLLALAALFCRVQPSQSFSWAFNSCAKLKCAQNSYNLKYFPRACGCSACLWEV